MADDKLRQELLYMAKITSKYDLTNMEVVEEILRLENERRILDSVFGKRFKRRIFDIAAGVNKDESCVICGKPAENHIICNHCLETIDDSPYAKSKDSVKAKAASKAKTDKKANCRRRDQPTAAISYSLPAHPIRSSLAPCGSTGRETAFFFAPSVSPAHTSNSV